MEMRKVKGLIDAIKASNLEEIEINLRGCSMRIARTGSGRADQPPQLKSPMPTIASGSGTPPNALSMEHVVRSPSVGISYASESPSQPPFVAVGTLVKPGDTLGIVATLNTSSRVEAAVPGTVIDILIKDGQPVEFDQPLFVIG
ncbi:acetyl-CoA carboxylase biotin carboxyl carrier protein [Lysobacter tyrosinilyticus]